ncbi:hypothetical protein D3C86_2109350 [compost metagenome]
MTHAIILLLGEKLVPMAAFAAAPLPVRLLVLAAYAGVLLAAAILTYLGVEKPARRALRRRMTVGAGPR